MFVEIERVSKDKLQSHYWRFHVSIDRGKLSICIWTYADRNRRTTRCKWVNEEVFSRLDKRHNTVSPADVPLPFDVKEELKAELKGQIDNAPVMISDDFQR